MDLSYTPEETQFRDEVRAFLDEALPQRLSDKVRDGSTLSKAEVEEWQAILSARGWLATHWPREYGGTGWNVVERFIFDVESSRANAPSIIPFGLSMLAPVLIKFGSDAQKERWLPRMLDGEDWWCQGYSEPGAGSDLANVRTTAVRDGDHYVVNGQKTWTTMAQHANMIFCLVRTDSSGKPQEGISFLLVDMTSPGVEVRPIITLDGDHEVNEVFFKDVRVPVENLVGEEGLGWTYAKYLLTYERTTMAGIGASRAALERLREIAQAEQSDGKPLIEDLLFAMRVARADIALKNLETTTMRVVAATAQGGSTGAQSSILKIKGTELRQEISALTRRAVGAYAQPFLPEREGANEAPVGPDYAVAATPTYLNLRKLSIYGGSNEIQKNIMTKAILGL
ncbi:pimeloyl-CoA dehydrogenase large subunit [Sulfitobacter sp. EhC04]|uniref:acyl-CoA dehydrogenase family protein n=1 Tax=Sulfitobacter sp. EhC04 TaxID=1849168 RepID=UPI0007F48510|nr:acyl-CoA dehydrogenase family protein [Sulfitobacter sp. EhC04]OAN75711.1 pimeloyl-CoA dehydrogenase large subunit [Sulfitobacter sp. EhC04]